MKRTVENIKDPLFRFFEREINLGAQLLRDIRHDLEEILGVCRAERKQSNETRALAFALQKGVVSSGSIPLFELASCVTSSCAV